MTNAQHRCQTWNGLENPHFWLYLRYATIQVKHVTGEVKHAIVHVKHVIIEVLYGTHEACVKNFNNLSEICNK